MLTRGVFQGGKGAAIIIGGASVIALGAVLGAYAVVRIGGTAAAGKASPLISASSSGSPADASTVAVQHVNGAVDGFPTDAPYCLVGRSGEDVQVYLYNGPGGYQCPAFAQQLAQDIGGYWQQEGREMALNLVCAVRSGSEEAIVMDSGGEIIGRSMCQLLQANGWTEDTATEQQIVAGQQSVAAAAAQAAASESAAAAAASASAAAVASQQAKESADFSNAQTAMSEISSDSGDLGSAVQNVDGALGEAATSLKQEQSDAANGAGEYCGNADTVDGDVDTVVGDEDTLEGDISSVSNYIDAVRTDIAALQNDDHVLSAEGVSVPSGAASVIVAGQQAVKDAIAKANADIDTMAGDVSTAYDVGNSLATGSCSGSAPGSAPAPPTHLS